MSARCHSNFSKIHFFLFVQYVVDTKQGWKFARTAKNWTYPTGPPHLRKELAFLDMLKLMTNRGIDRIDKAARELKNVLDLWCIKPTNKSHTCLAAEYNRRHGL